MPVDFSLTTAAIMSGDDGNVSIAAVGASTIQEETATVLAAANNKAAAAIFVFLYAA